MLSKKRKNNINNSESCKVLIKELDSFTIFDNLFNNDIDMDDIVVEVDEIIDDLDFTNWIDIDDDELDFINVSMLVLKFSCLAITSTGITRLRG